MKKWLCIGFSGLALLCCLAFAGYRFGLHVWAASLLHPTTAPSVAQTTASPTKTPPPPPPN